MEPSRGRRLAIDHERAVFDDVLEALRNFERQRGNEDEQTRRTARNHLDEMNARLEIASREADTADEDYAQFLVDDLSINRRFRRAEQHRRIRQVLMEEEQL
jgi:hypothetical protein